MVVVNLVLATLHERIVSVRPCKKPRVELASYVAQHRPACWKKASCMAIWMHAFQNAVHQSARVHTYLRLLYTNTDIGRYLSARTSTIYKTYLRTFTLCCIFVYPHMYANLHAKLYMYMKIFHTREYTHTIWMREQTTI